VEFAGSFPDPLVRLDPALPEVAFVGRSNVGKSSLINRVLGRKGLARVSQTPGKTTLLNVYRLPAFYIVDLPGYGFAKASKPERAAYRLLLERYLRERQSLAGVVWLLDIRHEPSADDAGFGELLAATGVPTLPVLTKGDKLSQGARTKRARELGRALGAGAEPPLVTSSSTGLGIADLGASILAAVAGGGPTP
jgi:GTP-binding protein